MATYIYTNLFGIEIMATYIYIYIASVFQWPQHMGKYNNVF